MRKTLPEKTKEITARAVTATKGGGAASALPQDLVVEAGNKRRFEALFGDAVGAGINYKHK